MTVKLNETSTIETPKEVIPATPIVETSSTNTSSETPPVITKEETPKTEESALSELGALKENEVPKEEIKKEAEAPIEYDIELSEGSPLTEKDLDSIVAKAEKYGWTKEETDSYISEKEELHSRGSESLRTKALEIVAAEKSKLLADPDFKGDKLPASLAAIDSVVTKYGDADLRAYLKGPGGNSLPLAKMLLKIGNLMKQDDIKGKGIGAKQSAPNTLENAYKNMYPSFFE